MGAMTNFFENKMIDFIFRGQALGLTNSTAGVGSGPSSIFVGLFTAAPTDSTAGTEVIGGSYARVAIVSALANWAGTQAAASTTASNGITGTTSNNSNILFPSPTASWGVVTSFGLFDAATGGNLLYYANLTANKTINLGDPAPAFAASELTVQVDD